MHPERWRQIESLYHLAREQGPGVLVDTDPEVRREVEKLLTQHSDGGILDAPAMDLIDEFTVSGTVPLGVPALDRETASHYSILEKIGAGGMGVVYKAYDNRLGRIVALKFLPHRLSHDLELKKRLGLEARAASALDHPNIVVIHDIDETAEGDLFIAMTFHEGDTLRERIAAGLTVPDALRIARQIASGLAKAHEHGIVHRDIKPSNVIVANDGVARIIDFGLARSHDAAVTADGIVRGTPLYMSPEQARGGDIDFRTDVWSLGAVLYEMLAKRPPFRGESQLHVMQAVTQSDPPPTGAPPAIESIITRSLRKDPTQRYQSAAEMMRAIDFALNAIEQTQSGRAGLRAIYALPIAALVLLISGLGFWYYQRSEKRHWAREQAIPRILALNAENKSNAALQLAEQAQRILPEDSQIARLKDGLVHQVSIRSSPPGATVEIRDYVSPNDRWIKVGNTPLTNVKIPSGYLRWRLTKPGFRELQGAPVYEDIHGYIREFDFPLDEEQHAPEGMVAVPASKFMEYIWSLGDLGPYDLPSFFIDRYEVTNRQYQDFVDRGGYTDPKYWKERFIADGHEVSRDTAMERLHDTTGRPGPSTWTAGHYPQGHADDPVSGVSWYEASAYAEFAGKSLPVLAQWYSAAPISVARFVTPLSNFSSAIMPVGKNAGLGAWGTYDMAGNVAEWCRNPAAPGVRFQLGGAVNTSTSEYFEPGELPAFHRASKSGFRCVKNVSALPIAAAAEFRQNVRDLSQTKPASDEVFRVYQGLYAYDHSPLNARLEPVQQDSTDWRKEKITLDAAYGKERFATYLFIPAHVKPPYQTIVFFPSAHVLDLHSSETLGDMKFIDFVIQSGRAVLYPVYKGTYERAAPVPGLDSVAARETLIQDSKDLGRSLDYLQTRPDFDHSRIGFLGESMGAALGVDLAAVEPRFKVVIFLDGGFFNEKALSGTDQVDFAPRLKAPTLLVTGNFDWIFTGKDALLKLLGAPSADKKGVKLDTAHDVSEQRADLIREVIAWLDKYLGKV